VQPQHKLPMYIAEAPARPHNFNCMFINLNTISKVANSKGRQTNDECENQWDLFEIQDNAE